MVCDIDQEILLLECLDNRGENDRHDLKGCGRHCSLRDQYAGVEVVLVDVLSEGAHLFYANRLFCGELDPDGTHLRQRFGVGYSFERCVFLHHLGGGLEGGGHFLAAVDLVSYAEF